jgi:hypothetical protein
MSSRKKIRQAPGRLLRQKLVTSSGVSQEWKPTFKGPETLDTALDSIHPAFKGPEENHAQTYILRLQGGVYILPDTTDPILNDSAKYHNK